MSASSERGTVALQVLALNDFFSAFEPLDAPFGTVVDDDGELVPAGGAACLATHLEHLRRGHPNTITVGTGDLYTGPNLLAHVFDQEPTVEFLGDVGMSIAAVGNHEFDAGVDELLRIQYGGASTRGSSDGRPWPGARFQYLAANVRRTDDDTCLLPPYIVTEFDGVRVGFIGAVMATTPGLVDRPAGVTGVRFVEEVDAVNEMVSELQGMGVHALVLLMHHGDFNLPGARPNGCGITEATIGLEGGGGRVARAVHGVSAVIGGHTFAAHVCRITGPDGRPRLYTQSAGIGRMITEVNLEISRETGVVLDGSLGARNHIVTRDVRPDPRTLRFLDGWNRRLAPLAERPVATILSDISTEQGPSGESPIGNLVADAHHTATSAPDHGGADLAFVYPPIPGVPFLGHGLVRGDAATGQPGTVTYADAFAVQPMDYSTCVISLTGAQVRDLLEEQWHQGPTGEVREVVLQPSSSLRYTINRARPVGRRVSAITIGGVALDERRTYRVSVIPELFHPRFGFSVFSQGVDATYGPSTLDALVTYLERHSPVMAPSTDRITVAGLP